MTKELAKRSLLMTPFDRCMFALLFGITLCWSASGVYNVACWMIGHSFRADHILAALLSIVAFVFKCRIVWGRIDEQINREYLIGAYDESGN